MQTPCTLLAFVPSANELLVCSFGEPSPLCLQLEKRGVKSPALLLSMDGTRTQVEGTIVELIDALPVLGNPAVSLELTPADRFVVPWATLFGVALKEVKDQKLLPWITIRRDNYHDPRPSGYRAHWLALSALVETDELHRLLSMFAAVPMEYALPLALPMGRLYGQRQLHAAGVHGGTPGSLKSLVRKVLSAACDRVVREAIFAGRVIRLGNPAHPVPSDSFEQRLLYALTQESNHLYVPLEGPHAEVGSTQEAHVHGLQVWSKARAASRLALDSGASADLDLFPSLPPAPEGWSAEESLSLALDRVLSQAALLAEILLTGADAPRTLPFPSRP